MIHIYCKFHINNIFSSILNKEWVIFNMSHITPFALTEFWFIIESIWKDSRKNFLEIITIPVWFSVYQSRIPHNIISKLEVNTEKRSKFVAYCYWHTSIHNDYIWMHSRTNQSLMTFFRHFQGAGLRNFLFHILLIRYHTKNDPL